MKHQTDIAFLGYINKYGCLFMCMTYWFSLVKDQLELSYEFLNSVWTTAIAKDIISGDLNGDGDMDDDGELLVKDKDKLMALAGIKLQYTGSFLPDNFPKKSGQFYIGEFHNNRTGFTHFIAIDENLHIVYDPILNSVTGREGFVKTVRVFS